MATTHAIPDTFAEMQAVWADLGPNNIVSVSGLTVPASSLTLPAVAVDGYVVTAAPPFYLRYVSQAAVSVTLAGGNGTYWLALHTDLSTTVAGWTRRAGSHYLWQLNATQPANPASGYVFCQLTVAGGVITAVTPIAERVSAPMSKQRSGSVAITGGNIAGLSSAASRIFRVDEAGLTGQTGFYSGLAASSGYALYFGGTAPSQFGGPVHLGTGPTFGDPAMARTNLGLGTMATQNANAVAITGGTATGLTQLTGTDVQGSLLTANSGLGVAETAQAARFLCAVRGIFRERLGVGNVDPSTTLEVFGTARVSGQLALGATINPAYMATLHFDRSALNGLFIRGLNTDAGVAHVIFGNAAGTGVGSITCSATTTAFNTTSDSRLKTDITPLTGALDILNALHPIAHRWKADGRPGVGFRAEEVAAVLDGVVTGEADAVDEAGQIVPQMMDYSKLVPWLAAALKETLACLDGLTQRLAALETAQAAAGATSA